MTPAQLAAFKTAINGDANLAAARAAGDHGAIAAYYNAASNPVVSLWRPAIPVEEFSTGIIWSDFVVLTAIKQNGYMAMTQGGFIDTTKANIRAGFAAIFTAGSSAANLTALAQRTGTRFEALPAFATVAGVASVSTVFGQVVTPADVAEALGS